MDDHRIGLVFRLTRPWLTLSAGRAAGGAIGLLLWALCGAACKERVGSPCTTGESTCADKTTALLCRNGVYAPVPCSGPLGCAKGQGHALCDTSVANVNDPCMGEDDEHACSRDKRQALVCRGATFDRRLECRGPAGCSMLGRTVACDLSLAEKGDPCPTVGAVACGQDRKQMLICQGGVFTVHRYCRGQFGCFHKGETPSCDETVSAAGDPCGITGQVVCSVDGKSELVCQGGAFVKSITCKNGCTVSTRPGRPIDCQ